MVLVLIAVAVFAVIDANLDYKPVYKVNAYDTI